MIEFHWKGEIDPIAVYAAVVSTAAVIFAGVNVWRNRARLAVTATPDIMIIGSENSDNDESDLVAVRAVNRGNKATTVLGLYITDRGNVWNRIRRADRKHFAVLNPQPKGYPPVLPKVLNPNEEWTGYIRLRLDIIPDLLDGNHLAVISATHSEKAASAVIPKLKPAKN